jgi:hypothetical protein
MDLKPSENKNICTHGNHGYCGLCANMDAPRCVHGNPHFCGFCYEKR